MDDVIRVVIADDNRAFRRGVRLRLEHAEGIVVVGEAANGRDAVAAALGERADVVLMDLEMPGMNGIEATRSLRRDALNAPRVIVLTWHGEHHLALSALAEGASGYLLKTHDTSQLVEAIRAAHRGDALLSTRVTTPLLEQIALSRLSEEDRRRVRSLTPAEARVVELLSQGVTTNELLASRLLVSVNTIRTHIQAALKKADVTDRTQLALWGVRMEAELASRPNGRF